MHVADAARWQQLSPLLDELLDLEDAARREERLAALRAEDAALADELAALLRRHGELEAQQFLGGPALPPPADWRGRLLGPYTLEREIGRGGMGQVWLARRHDGCYDGVVAIKLLQGGLLGHGDAGRFAREGRILARLDHRHIARLLDAGVTDDGRQPYLVLEYVDGVPIDRYAEDHALALPARLALMLDVLDAVAHAHDRLILHRDVKPSNVLVSAGGVVKLLDFGIAKLLEDQSEAPGDDLTQRAGVAFTPQHAAPEQLQGGDVTTATDVYALGVMLYMLLGGGHPTGESGTTTLARMRSTIEVEPRRLSDAVLRRGGSGAERRARELRGDIDTIVAKALKKAPEERYGNAAELADDLRRFLGHQPIAARPDAFGYRAAKFARRNRLAIAAGSFATLALVSGATLAFLEAREAQAQRAQAEGLIEFMLGDLRTRLQPVGRLDALDAVGEKALGYYAVQAESRLDAGSLSRRAKALHLIGEIAEQRGQMAEAGQRFTQAAKSTAELLARTPDDPQRIFDHAQSEYWVAYVAWQQRRAAEAEAGFKRYLALAEQLVRIDPDKPEWRKELGSAAMNLGVLEFENARPRPALAYLARSRDIFERESATRPQVAVSLSRALGWIARVHENLDESDQAVAAHRARIQALERANDGNTSAYGVALAYGDVGRLLLARGDIAAARAELARAASRLDQLAALDPSNQDWQGALAFAQVAQAEALHAGGQPREALERIELARRIAAPLWAGEDKALFNVALRGRWLAVRAALAAPDAALLAEMAAYVDRIERSEAAGKRYSRVHQRQVTAATLALGDALAARGQTEAARQRWRRVDQRLAALTRLDSHETTLRAHALQRLDNHQDARVLVDKVTAGSYRHPLVLDLLARMGRAP